MPTVRLSRRSFLKAGSAVCLLSGITTPLLASVLQGAPSADFPDTNLRLEPGWEFYRGPLDARFQVWHSEELVVWQDVSVPHCFNAYDACDPDVPAYRGEGWYRRLIEIKNPYASGRTLLHFEGAGQRSEIYIGDTLAGTHSGGYDEFLIDITDFCHNLTGNKRLPLAVLCDNSPDIERMPSDLSDFTLYGGLYRHVHLVYLPAVSIQSLVTHAAWEPGKPAKLTVNARLYSPEPMSAPVAITLKIVAPDGRQILERTIQGAPWKGDAEIAAFDIDAPVLWSTDTPNLYRCSLTLKVAGASTEVSHRFGIRHVHFEEHGPFFLNGVRLPIRGTHRHEDHAGVAAAMPDELIREEMHLMKKMGANFVRLAHYQQSRLVLDLCDELGLLVWEELPWCRSGVGSALFQERGRQQLTNMIEQHRNHPSVIFWGLGNENDWPMELNGKDHAAIRTYMAELRDLAHRLDPTRLTSIRRCDFAKDIPDVYSPSIWAGWYSGKYTEYRAALEKARYSVPQMLHVEFGADSHAGRHAEDADPALTQIATGHGTAEAGLDYKPTGGANRASRDGEWTETYACELFDWYLKTLEEVPWLSGAVQWVFKDFTTPLRVQNPVPRINQKGLLTRDMTPKEGYFVFQSHWASEPMLRIYGHDWPIRWGHAGQTRQVRVYSNCAEVELFLNGVSVGTRKRNAKVFPCSGLQWELVFREGNNTLRAEAHQHGQMLTDAIEFTYQTRPWGEPASLRLILAKRTAGATQIEATLLDATGTRCLDARTLVRFALAGEGRLNDNLGTPTGSRVVQMCNGRSMISLTHTGAVVASVEAEGVPAAFLSLPSPA